LSVAYLVFFGFELHRKREGIYVLPKLFEKPTYTKLQSIDN